MLLVYLPSALLPPHPTSHLSTAPHGHTLLQAFLLLGFSLNRSKIAAPVVFSKLTLSWFKINQNALLH